MNVWARLSNRLARPPHALLLHGPKGIGKLHLAQLLAQAMLCEAPDRSGSDGLPCGQCEGCHWFGLSNHPDYRLVIPEADAEAAEEGSEAPARSGSKTASKQIRIDQVRVVGAWLAVGGHRSKTRVAVIHPAEAMNPSTANALLKTLEEPTEGALLILVSHHPDRLLPTIRSRCQAVPMGSPTGPEALAWLNGQGVGQGVNGPERALALAGGAPLSALERPHLAELATQLARDLAAKQLDPIGLTDSYQSTSLADLIDLLQKWMYDLIGAKFGRPVHYFHGSETQIHAAAAAIDPVRALHWWRQLGQARALAEHPLNIRLVLESLFIEYEGLRGVTA